MLAISEAVVLYVANKQVNEFMRKLGMRPVYKWFVSIVLPDKEHAEKMLLWPEERILVFMEDSYQNDLHYWVPAIQINNNFHHRKDVKILSDGRNELFMPIPDIIISE